MNRRARVVIAATVILVLNYVALFWQTSAFIFALGSFIILGVAGLWIISIVRRRG